MHRLLAPVVICLLLLGSGCGGDDGDGAGTTTAGPTESTGTDDSQSETTTTTDDESEYAGFCADEQALLDDAQTRLFFTTPDGPPDFNEFRDRQAALADDAPPELADALQALATYDFEANGLAGVQRDLADESATVNSWISSNCEPQPVAAEPTFEIDHTEGTGQQSVYFVRGECPDGSFPTEVSGPSGLFASGPATDLGGGLYSFSLPLKDGIDPLDPLVLEETQIPDEGVDGTCP